jgi:hypothetical protein
MDQDHEAKANRLEEQARTRDAANPAKPKPKPKPKPDEIDPRNACARRSAISESIPNSKRQPRIFEHDPGPDVSCHRTETPDGISHIVGIDSLRCRCASMPKPGTVCTRGAAFGATMIMYPLRRLPSRCRSGRTTSLKVNRENAGNRAHHTRKGINRIQIRTGVFSRPSGIEEY